MNTRPFRTCVSPEAGLRPRGRRDSGRWARPSTQAAARGPSLVARSERAHSRCRSAGPEGEHLHHLAVGDERHGHVWADDEPRQEVAEHHRLTKPVEDHGGDGRDAEDRRERAQEVMGATHGLTRVHQAGTAGATANGVGWCGAGLRVQVIERSSAGVPEAVSSASSLRLVEAHSASESCGGP